MKWRDVIIVSFVVTFPREQKMELLLLFCWRSLSTQFLIAVPFMVESSILVVGGLLSGILVPSFLPGRWAIFRILKQNGGV